MSLIHTIKSFPSVIAIAQLAWLWTTMRWLKAPSLIVLSLLILSLPIIANSKQLPTEYQVKAAFVYNIIKFVDWPPEKLSGKEHINLCIFGGGKITSALTPIEKKKAQGKHIQISAHYDNSTLHTCDVIYFSGLVQSSIRTALDIAQNNHSLTISDAPGFAKSGGMVELRKDKDSVKIVINLTASSQAGLTFSSKLLSLAILVK